MCDDGSPYETTGGTRSGCQSQVIIAPEFAGTKTVVPRGPKLSSAEREAKYQAEWKASAGPKLRERFSKQRCGGKRCSKDALFCSDHSNDGKCVVCQGDTDRRWKGDNGSPVWVCKKHADQERCCICGKTASASKNKRLYEYTQKVCQLCMKSDSWADRCCFQGK
jgi:hypothetical protein